MPDAGYVVAPGEGDAFWMFDSVDTIKADSAQTRGRLGVVEFHEFEGSGPPSHLHADAGHGFYVLEGSFTFALAGEISAASQGSWVFVPPGVAHTWRCDTPEGRMLSVFAPAGFENFYREVGDPMAQSAPLPARTEPDAALLAPVAARHGVTIVGPPIDT